MTDGNTITDQEKAALVKEEKARTSLERYKMKIIGEVWVIIPLSSFFYLLYALYGYYRYGTYELLFLIIAGCLFGAAWFVNNTKEEWEKGLWIKYEAHGYPDREILVRRFFEGENDGKLSIKKDTFILISQQSFIFIRLRKLSVMWLRLAELLS